MKSSQPRTSCHIVFCPKMWLLRYYSVVLCSWRWLFWHMSSVNSMSHGSSADVFNPEERNSRFLRNVATYLGQKPSWHPRITNCCPEHKKSTAKHHSDCQKINLILETFNDEYNCIKTSLWRHNIGMPSVLRASGSCWNIGRCLFMMSVNQQLSSHEKVYHESTRIFIYEGKLV